MYNEILVPVALFEGSDTGRALKVAQKLLSKGGTITLFTVVETIPPFIEQEVPIPIYEGKIKEAREKLADYAEGMKNVKTDVFKGHPANSILQYAKEKEVDCIVIASHRPGMQDYFLGSTAARVVRHAPVSVHVVR